MRIAFVELEDGLLTGSEEWSRLAQATREQGCDVLLTNEMPFGRWLPAGQAFDPGAAAEWVRLHEEGLNELKKLPVRTVLSSRPVLAGGRLANEGFALLDGGYVRSHQKHYFPEEPGWWEARWFAPALPGFDVVDVGGLRVGFLLCTELFFNEWARHYKRQQADVIVVPMASGVSVSQWHAAARMAAIVSGVYVISSNRVGGREPAFGGRGFAIDPEGELAAETNPETHLTCIDLDLAWVKQRRSEYPCYVAEFG